MARLVVGCSRGAADDFFDFFFGQHDGEHAILHAVVGEDVGERRSDHGAEAEIFQGPDGVFARRSAAEILAGHENAGSLVARLVQ